jgi:hypothetical protein
MASVILNGSGGCWVRLPVASLLSSTTCRRLHFRRLGSTASHRPCLHRLLSPPTSGIPSSHPSRAPPCRRPQLPALAGGRGPSVVLTATAPSPSATTACLLPCRPQPLLHASGHGSLPQAGSHSPSFELAARAPSLRVSAATPPSC